MTEVCAAMGLTSLESVEEFIGTNRRNYQAYGRGLDGIPGINLMHYDESERANYQYIVLEVDEREAGLTRDALVEVLFAENVLARRYFFPGLPSHGAVSVVLSPCLACSAGNRNTMPSGDGSAERNQRGRAGGREDLRGRPEGCG